MQSCVLAAGVTLAYQVLHTLLDETPIRPEEPALLHDFRHEVLLMGMRVERANGA